MKERTVLFKRKLGVRGNSIGVTIPTELLAYLEAVDGDTIILCADSGKYGNFISIWVEPEPFAHQKEEVEDGK